jgi:hypothetical protein
MPNRYDDWERRRRRKEREMDFGNQRERDYRDDWENFERGYGRGRGRAESIENPYDTDRPQRYGRRVDEGTHRGGRQWRESDRDWNRPRYEGNWGPGRFREREDWETYGRPEDFGGETGYQGGYRRDWEDQERYGDRMDWERNREMMDRSRDWDRPGPEDWDRDRRMRDRDRDRERQMRGGRDWDRGYYWDEEQDPDRNRWRDRSPDIGFEEDYESYDYEEPYDWSYTEVWTIEGPYSGIGPQGYQRSDDRIFEEVCERLTHHGQIDASNIEVEVNEGEVTLKGNVNNRHIKRMAEDTIATVPGVMDVHNQLKTTDRTRRENIRRDQHMRGQPRTQIREQIRDRMKVLGREKQEIGEVKEIRENDFLVDRPLARDVYVPFDACYEITHDRIVLNIRADEVNDQNWPVPEIIETDRGDD